MMRRIRIAAVATVALCGAMLILPRLQPAVSAAEKVRQSLAHINTWHLRGWKLLDGKQVAWEVWGRDKPFFYREQLGDETVVDDGRLRTRVLEPAPELGRDNGVIVQTPSQRGLGVVGDGFTSAFKVIYPGRSIARETASEMVFEMGNDLDQQGKHDLYTVSKRTWLPMRYDVRTQKGPASETVEHLDAEYDEPLAESLRHVERPAGYLVADSSVTPERTQLPGDNVAHDGSLTVQFTPLAMDEQGRILARVRGWLGDTAIMSSPFFMHVVQMPFINAREVVKSNVDDHNRPYMMVPVEGLRLIPDMNPGVDHLIYLAPLKPFKDGEALPRRIQVMLHIAPWVSARQSGGSENRGQQQCILMSASLTWNVALPDTPRALNPDAYLPAGWRERVKTTGVDIPALDALVADARAQIKQALGAVPVR
jgi:hypothetical protein